jgi:rubrerythrin
MTFETKYDVLSWYEKQQRTLTPRFIEQIEWHRVRDFPLDQRLVPVLMYMRDVETLTDMYYSELRRTPTGKDPVISKFMERWGIEETTHGETLDRFLVEAGIPSSAKWQDEVRSNVSKFYRFNSRMITSLTNLVGRKFTATHMTFGAIHEMSTTQGYRRLMKLADHPVLSQILNGIIREESAHTKFYLSIARLELRRNDLAQKIARYVIEHFWQPVGQGSLPKERTDYVIATLFGGADGRDCAERTVSQRIRQLPGFSDLTRIMETVDQICAAQPISLVPAINLDALA